MDKPYNLTLCMIVKNEADNIKGTLENVVKNFNIDYWVISDTGSTDSTIDIIKETFEKLNIPGKLHNKEWKDFSTNRNYVIEEAETVSNFLLFFDADDAVVGNFKLPELTDDSYLMKFGPSFVFHRIFIVKTNHKWRYKGILHEFISCDFPYTSKVTITGDYYVIPGTHGCRSKDPNKYLNDALVFEKALIDKETPKDMLGRYNYYCAQSYKDASRMDRAIDFYKKTIDSDAWIQEKYIACKMLGIHYKETDFKKAIHYFTKSKTFDNSRVDCLLELANMFDDDALKLNILTSITPENVADPMSDKFLFIDALTHNVYYFNTVIILAYNLGEQQIVCSYLTEQLKRYKSINNIHLISALNNVKLCLDNYENDMLLNMYSITNKILFSGKIKYNEKEALHELGKKKMENIVCKRNNIPNEVLNCHSNKSVNIVFKVNHENSNQFEKTFYSFINCFKDRHLIQDYYLDCSKELLQKIRKNTPQFNFVKSYDDIVDCEYTISLNCNHYFSHRETYLDIFMKKLNDDQANKISFEKDKGNYIIDNITENNKVINMSFDIMSPFKKIELIEVDVDFSKIKFNHTNN